MNKRQFWCAIVSSLTVTAALDVSPIRAVFVWAALISVAAFYQSVHDKDA